MSLPASKSTPQLSKLWRSLPFFMTLLCLWRLQTVACTRITSLTLINTSTNQPIRSLLTNDILDLAHLDGNSLGIRAEIGGVVRSVQFSMDENVVTTNNWVPFDMFGFSADLVTSRNLTAVPYAGIHANGPSGPPYTVSYRVVTSAPMYTATFGGRINGERKVWHKITLGLRGPSLTESGAPNPFTDFRLDVTFTSPNGQRSFIVPGYYAADGNAALTGATSGNVWLCHFTPDERDTWQWTASFYHGPNVAQNGGGTPYLERIHGKSGQFNIFPTDKTGRDLRGKGRLEYVGEHHLRFAGTGEWFLKAGADSPENLLAYEDFDNTPNNGSRRKSWAPHDRDYLPTDPTWSGGKGTELIGAVNYLSNQGMNAFSFLTMNIGGDDKNVFPYLSDAPSDRLRMDTSKLAQWEIVFAHADRMGMYLHFKTQETENDQLLDGGELGNERKLYYRELIARFGHHLALNWNIGEENTNTDVQRLSFADYFKAVDPYGSPLVVHTWPGDQSDVYTPLLGEPSYDGASIQHRKPRIFVETRLWVKKSAQAGHRWVVANDEQNPATEGVLPDIVDPNHNADRQQVLWGNLMAGGAGVEYYFGYSYSNSDLTCQDFRSRANMWTQSRHALEFFIMNEVPFWAMINKNSRVGNNNWALELHDDYNPDDDDKLVIFKRRLGPVTAALGKNEMYTVDWYNPRLGGDLQRGQSVIGAADLVDLGTPPDTPDEDWVVWVQRVYSS